MNMATWAAERRFLGHLVDQAELAASHGDLQGADALVVDAQDSLDKLRALLHP